MTALAQFLWAFLGSTLAVLVALDRHFLRRTELPRRFRSPAYVVARLLLAVAAGLLAIAFDPAAPLQAVYLGVTAPWLVRRMIRRASSFRTNLHPLRDRSSTSPRRR